MGIGDGGTSLRMHLGRCALSASVSLQCRRNDKETYIKYAKNTTFVSAYMSKMQKITCLYHQICQICQKQLVCIIKYVKYARNSKYEQICQICKKLRVCIIIYTRNSNMSNIPKQIAHCPTCFHVCCPTRSPETLKCFTLNLCRISKLDD